MVAEIYPCILAHSLEEYATKLELVESTSANWVQIDIMDGKFVPNISILPHEIESISTRLSMEAHMMTYAPERYFSDLSIAGFKRVLIHLEIMEEVEELVRVCKLARDYFPEVGFVLNPETTISQVQMDLEPDSIQIMGVHPGQSGQQILEDTVSRISQVKALADHTVICIDGGVTEDNIKILHEAGATRFVIASHLFVGANIENSYQHFKQLVTGGI